MKLEGFFSGLKNANSAVEKLKAEGIRDAVVDLNDHYTLDDQPRAKEYAFLPTTNLSDLVLNSGNPEGHEDESPLLAASPMVSGMGGFEEIADINYKIVVNADSKDKEKIENIIKSLDGTTNDPNLNIHEHIEDIDFPDM